MSVVMPTEIVSFWREAGPEKWFAQDDAFDMEIKSRFLKTHEAAARGELAALEENAEGALALVILLDQFPRNMFRGNARAFATDPLARAVADRAIARASIKRLTRRCGNSSVCRSCIPNLFPIRIGRCVFTRRSATPTYRSTLSLIATSSRSSDGFRIEIAW